MTTIQLHGGPLDGLSVSVGPGEMGDEKSLPFLILDGRDVYERIRCQIEHGDRYCWVDPAAVPGAPADWPLRKLRMLPATRQEWRWLRLDRG